MKQEQAISDEVIEAIQLAINRNENWMAYNNSLYFIEKEDIQFFTEKHAAEKFISNNYSDYDHYTVIRVQSLEDVFRQIPYGEILSKILNNLSTIKNLSIMNEQNLEYLKDNLKYMGFGEKQNEALEQHLKENKESFQLSFSAEINNKKFDATLNFRKSDSSDMYFFNSYQATLERKNGEKEDQTFYLNKGKGVTAKEAFNLLDGRAVHKELNNKTGEPYNAWIQLDFQNKDKNNNNEVKQYHENYGFDLKAAVSKFAIIELNDTDNKKALMQSLQKGNIQSVNVEKDGSVHKMFIEANPQYKTVNLYDANMKRVQKEDVGHYQSIVPTTETIKKEDKSIKLDKKQGERNNQSRKDGSLLPKKRERQKKGLNIL